MQPTDPVSPLFTDLYELTMAAGYHAEGMRDTAVFSLFARRSPNRGYFVAAGLETALSAVGQMRFSESDMAYLDTTGLFSPGFLAALADFRFTGTIRAVPEGTIVFPDEPLLEVSAPIVEAQILETFLINTLGFQTLIATKAARCIHAAGGRALIDFSLRRTQAWDAGMQVARCTHIAGFAATSNVLAGKRWNIPVSGTMAHSFVGAFDSETAAFAAYARTFPDRSVFLIDTYDTLQGAKNAVAVALEMKAAGRSLLGVRLDSGEMVRLSRAVRRILDDAGLEEVKIFASSGFDEYEIARVIADGAAIDAFGVGTKMGVSADAPYLDMVYKMVRLGKRNIRKLSPGKVTLAGEKQVFRTTDAGGRFAGDIIGTAAETLPDARPLLREVMREGRRIVPEAPLSEIRERFTAQFAALGDRFKSIDAPAMYPVTTSDRLAALQPVA